MYEIKRKLIVFMRGKNDSVQKGRIRTNIWTGPINAGAKFTVFSEGKKGADILSVLSAIKGTISIKLSPLCQLFRWPQY